MNAGLLLCGFVSLLPSQDVEAPAVRPVFADEFTSDTRTEYQAKAVEFEPGALRVMPDGFLRRNLDAGAIVEVTVQLTPAGDSTASMTFGVDNVSPRVEWSWDRAGATVIVHGDGIRQSRVTEPGLQWNLSYRYGLLTVRQGEEIIAVAHADLRNAAVRSVQLACERGTITVGRLAVRAVPAARDYSATEVADFERVSRLAQEAGSLIAKARFGDAIPLWEEIARIRQQLLGVHHPDYSQCLNNLGYLHSILGNHDEAELNYRQAVQLDRKLLSERHPDYLTGVNNLALLLRETGGLEEADELFAQILPLQRQVLGDDHLDVARTQNNYAMLLERRGRYAEAERLYSQALQTRRKKLGQATNVVAGTLGNLGNLYARTGDFLKAEQFHRRSLKIRDSILSEDHPDRAITLNSLAELAHHAGDYEQAIALSEQAVAIWKSRFGAQHPSTAIGLSNLAGYHEKAEDYPKARELFDEALRAKKAAFGGDHVSYAHTLVGFAALHQSIGDDDSAIMQLDQALKIYSDTLGKDSARYATALNNLAGVHNSGGRLESAREQYESALAIRGRVIGTEHPHYAQTLSNLAGVLKAQGKLREALERYQSAEEIIRSHGTRNPMYAQITNNLGVIHVRLGNLEEARSCFATAVGLARQLLGTDHSDYANYLIGLGHVAIHQQDYALADKHLSEAFEVHRRLLALTTSMQSERQQLLFKSKVSSVLDLLLSVKLLAQSRPQSTLSLIAGWKGAAQLRQRDYRVLQENAEAADLLAEHSHVVARRLAVLRQPSESGEGYGRVEPEGRSAQLMELVRQQEELERRLASHSEGFKDYAAPPDVSELASTLPPGTALIDYFQFQFSRADAKQPGRLRTSLEFVAHVLRHDGRVTVHRCGSAAELTAAIEQWRRDFGMSPRAQEAAARLRAAVWQPLVEDLEDIETVLISPDGILAKLPFAALPGQQQGGYLIEDLRIVHLAVPRILLSPSPAREATLPSGDFLVIGGVNYDGVTTDRAPRAPRRRQRGQQSLPLPAFASLPETGVEVREMEHLYRQLFRADESDLRVLTGNDATEANVRQLVAKFANLHIATHGYFAPEGFRSRIDVPITGDAANLAPAVTAQVLSPGLLSGLALAGANQRGRSESDDGILTAAEIANLPLRHTRLVVLSACETGLGLEADGEALLGMQRAFQIAGARTTIASLWKVDDLSTRRLMARFYRNYWEREMSPLEALRQAQLSILRSSPADRGTPRNIQTEAESDNSRRASPRLWAAFQVSGEWR